MSTLLQQTRRATYVSGSIENFSIETLVTNKGDLPYTEIFVKEVTNRDDPKDDIFSRVANIADLTTLERGRDAAAAATNADTFSYLDSEFVIYYDSLDLAIAGQQAIKDRVNKLITDWTSYQNSFEAYPSPVTITLPVGTNDAVTLAINAYKTAKQDRVNKEKLFEEASDALNVAQDKQAIYADFYTNITFFASGAADRTAEMTTCKTALSTLLLASETFLSEASANPPSDPEKAVFSAALTSAGNSQAQALTDITDHTQYQTNIATYATTVLSSKTVADTALISATSAKTVADQDLTDALQVEEDALNAVLALCPDFDPTTIIVAPTV